MLVYSGVEPTVDLRFAHPVDVSERTTMRILSYLFQPGVLLTALIGTLLQIGLAFANAHNLAGVGDAIANYGLIG